MLKSALKRYANERGVYLFGDMPFYLDRDSVEVWWNPELFRLGADAEPEAVSGVPPDYFSSEGQLWGNPVYRWDVLRSDDFAWWAQRLGHDLALFDRIRIDHFRGLVQYWEIPATEQTAVNGKWADVPTDEVVFLFKFTQRHAGH